MKKHIYIILLISISISETIFNIEKDQSIVKWKGSKSTGSYHDGLISIKNGFININDNIITSGKIIIDMNSITCTDINDPQSNQYLIDHLKNDDFFFSCHFSNCLT